MSNKSPRSEERRSRRAERKAAEERAARNRRLGLVVGAIGLALIAGLALILVPRVTSGNGGGISDIVAAEGAPTGVPTSDRTMGDPNAPVTVVEWGDYQ
ncbi:MAG TPA: hypothetical protein VFI42_01485 [Thermomicrobiaceae bacterium]|nr:hypothetical protein [Thermomicrobiaceae bacterium]